MFRAIYTLYKSKPKADEPITISNQDLAAHLSQGCLKYVTLLYNLIFI